MTHPRRQTVFDDRPGLYHCVTRCVRQAFLCDKSPPCGRDGESRRAWVERRILDLAESFAVGIYAWAAMANHCHIALLLDPLKPREWSDEEVARRWCRINQYPGRPVPAKTRAQRETALLANPERLLDIRGRLGSLSWFMRFVNEGVARRANAEDGCKGRFWDGRFKSQNLLDDRAALAAMAYVDLNPVRAGIAEHLDECEFTSITWRLAQLRSQPELAASQLQPLAGIASSILPAITLQSYVRLVTWTGLEQRPGKRGRLKPSSLDSNGAGATHDPWWLLAAGGLESRFAAFVGLPGTLERAASRIGRRWLRGSHLDSGSRSSHDPPGEDAGT
ncbi:MAG: transposase [Gammaproteobacteria bacterium]|nr:transposase [Gammaproteobacteria bacterium]